MSSPNTLKDCEHCRNNSTGKPPFLKMKTIPVKGMKTIEKAAKAEGKNPNCFICETTQSLIEGLRQHSKD